MKKQTKVSHPEALSQKAATIPAENQVKIAGVPVSITPEGQEAAPGGELHQVADGTHPQMTNNRGTVVADDENSLKAGLRGPVLTEDFFLVEKTQHFDHERIPERIVHARGYGAHGYFELTDFLKGITKAKVLTTVGQKPPVFTRFSTVAGNMGSSDLARDVRGFAVKMYTPEGNWDIVGNNIPVFFIQDAIKFTDLIHAATRARSRISAGPDRS
jgi:catalase